MKQKKDQTNSNPRTIEKVSCGEIQESKRHFLDIRKMLTREEVRECLKVKSIQTVINYTNRGLLTAYKIGRRVLYNEDEVLAALASGQVLRYQHETTRQYIFRNL